MMSHQNVHFNPTPLEVVSQETKARFVHQLLADINNMFRITHIIGIVKDTVLSKTPVRCLHVLCFPPKKTRPYFRPNHLMANYQKSQSKQKPMEAVFINNKGKAGAIIGS